MTDLHQANCPLCNIGSDFKYIESDGQKRQHFYCEQCKEFVITDTAKRKLSGNGGRCEQLSKLSASLSENELLHIFHKDREIKFRVENKGTWRHL